MDSWSIDTYGEGIELVLSWSIGIHEEGIKLVFSWSIGIHGEGIKLVLSWSTDTWRGNRTGLIMEYRYMERG